ncbi:MAG: MFS transporter, partial [Dehalococcoidia bacterium]|nr:MFS transporter [Dehalococcoidia bacterium]
TIGYPAISAALGADLSEVVWVGIGYFLVSAGLLFFMGWLGDTLGRRKVYVWGMVLIAVALGLSALADNIFQLICCRLVMAVGVAMAQANATAIVVEAFPVGERGRGLGILGGVQGAGLAAGPLAGGYLLASLGWPALFYIRIPLAMTAALLAWATLHPTPRQGMARPDILGSVSLFMGFGGLLVTVNRVGKMGVDSLLVWAPAAVALVLLAVFPLVERRASQPVLNPTLFSNRSFILAQGGFLFHFASWGVMMFLTPFYLVEGLGYSSQTAGLLFALFPGMRVVLAPLAGSLSDRIGVKIPCSVGLLIMAVGLGWLSRLGPGPDTAQVAAAFAVAGVGSALFDPVGIRAIMESVPRSLTGTASASVPAARQLGGSVGGALGGAILAAQGSALGTAAVVAGFSTAVIIATAMVMLGMAACLLRTKAGGLQENA